MNEQSTQAAPIAELHERDVESYLRTRPDFLFRHPHLLMNALAPARDFGDTRVVDFQPALIKALRQQLSQTGDLATEIVEAGRETSRQQARIHQAVLRLIEARDMSEFHPLIAADLPLLLELEAIVILSSEDRLDNRASAILRPTIFRPGQAALIRQLFPTSRAVELQQDITGDPAIYGKEQACLVASQALVHLQHSDLSMVVAFASRDPKRFHPDLATDLMVFLARVLVALIQKHAGG